MGLEVRAMHSPAQIIPMRIIMQKELNWNVAIMEIRM